MDTWSVFGLFLLIRLLSVFVVQTWFVPDEYWQSLEVAHKFVYGYGYITWEWAEGIRSYLHPIIFTLLYKLLNFIRLDTAEMLILAPRILQATLSAYSDLCFWKWCGKTKWSIFSIATSWFWFFNATRTLVNTLETSLTIIALSKFPMPSTSHKHNDSFLWIVGFLCAIRPTAVIVWIPLCVYHVFTSKKGFLTVVLFSYLPVMLVVIIVSCLIDSLCHGSFVLTWWQFLRLNVLEGISEEYGQNPWHFYLAHGFPAIMGIYMVPFVLSTVHILRYRDVYVEELILLATLTFSITVYSCLSHKEFRFIMPVLPIALRICSDYLTNWSRKTIDILVWVVATVILISNAVPALYFSQFHQKGSLTVMQSLQEITNRDVNGTSLLFLMPCHSTPWYSHLHVNVTARFLTCNPNLAHVDGYVTEVDSFYKSPSQWLRNNYPPNKPLPSHIITYDMLVPHLSDIFSKYTPIERIFNSISTNSYINTDQRVGKYVLIHQNVDYKPQT